MNKNLMRYMQNQVMQNNHNANLKKKNNTTFSIIVRQIYAIEEFKGKKDLHLLVNI
jgi:hypothetical protein